MEENKTVIDLIADLNIPKQLLDKSERLLVSLFGQSMQDVGGIISDKVRLRRFKNQVTILEKAEEYVRDKGINPRKLNLRVLAPMVEFSSLEEDENLQNRWSHLIANTLTKDSSVRTERKCVLILSNISSDEAVFFDKLFDMAVENRKKRLEKFKQKKATQRKVISENDILLEKIYISLNSIKESLDITHKDIVILIEGLVSLEIVKWDVPNVDVCAEKSWDDPDDLNIDVNVTVDEPDGIYITHLGVEFIKMCNK